MKYTKIPTNIRKSLQLNAGILVDSFDPATGTIGNILGATSGGFNFTATPTFTDFFEDVDNAPKNTKEGKVLDEWEASASGTFISVTKMLAKKLVAAADYDETNDIKIVPRNDILLSDFHDLSWVGDYSDVNTGEDAGFMAIHLINALSTGGFQLQSGDNAKGQFSFEFMGHYSVEDIDRVPFEIFIKSEDSSTTGSITLNTHSATVVESGTVTLTATAIPSSAEVTWTSANTDVATVLGGVVTGVFAGNTIITASITVDGVTYNDTCTIVVTEE